ncbi:DUF418 domain-containing protein [Paenibacillus paridis]|uniref:DUF418 domain-containing protein n=1 Tax=Paenibacillus paridis TaxID=2583376 RepID=UPI00111CFD07|nr:DUF418 domain-containing protein [Paenibacillus paridis]
MIVNKGVIAVVNAIETGSRIRIMDAIRGFSLLGILIANMLIFQYGIYGKEEMQHFNPTRLDHVMHHGLQIIVEGSFMPIFMFLFGYSLVKLRESLVAKGHKPAGPFIRRFLMLMGLGLLHSIFLWEGDILLAYGLAGFCLLLFVKRTPRTLVIWGIILSVLMAGISYGSEQKEPKAEQRMQAYVEKSITVNGEGTYKEIMDFRQKEDPLDLPEALLFFVLLLMPLILLPMFLLGIAAAKKQWFHNPKRERRKYSWAMAIFLPIGLATKSAAVLLPEGKWNLLLLTAGGPLLALGYIFGLALLLSYLSKSSKIIMAFEAVGRMSMTNYLMQTVISTTIFYGYGLGWFGKIGVLNGLLLALLIYALQAVVSSWVLRRFKNGPFERLLRMWTYWSFSGKTRSGRKLSDTPGVNTGA